MPEYKIGLDFGTTNSILSYLENNDLKTFKYGNPGQQQEYIPSFISYDEDFVEIGINAHLAAANNPEAESYGNFKMRLPLHESEFANHFQNNHTPMKITADYLKELLFSEDNTSFKREKGEIAGLVVSVPEIWQRDPANLGRERLKKLIEELGLPLIQLVSEPVAATAYYIWSMQQQAKNNGNQLFSGNLLVCDMGGGTFDVTLCNIDEESNVKVLYFDGEGDKGLKCGGVAFDRHCVQMAYHKKHGEYLDENNSEFIRLLKEFESIKLGYNSQKFIKQINNYFKDTDNYGDKNIYTFTGGYSVNSHEIIEAFKPIESGINKVLNRVKDWLEENQIGFDRLFLVGGFSQFYLVQKAIIETLGIEQEDPRLERNFNVINSAYAISYGACLIANGLIDPVESYIHSIGIFVKKKIETENIERGEIAIQEEKITLIQGGTSLDKLKESIFYEQPLIAWSKSFSVPLWIDPKTKGEFYRITTPESVTLPNYSQEAKYLVGMRVDSSQIAYLIIEEINSKTKVEYELGNIIDQTLGGFYKFDS